MYWLNYLSAIQFITLTTELSLQIPPSGVSTKYPLTSTSKDVYVCLSHFTG